MNRQASSCDRALSKLYSYCPRDLIGNGSGTASPDSISYAPIIDDRGDVCHFIKFEARANVHSAYPGLKDILHPVVHIFNLFILCCWSTKGVMLWAAIMSRRGGRFSYCSVKGRGDGWRCVARHGKAGSARFVGTVGKVSLVIHT
jgi:hypothetical protein